MFSLFYLNGTGGQSLIGPIKNIRSSLSRTYCREEKNSIYLIFFFSSHDKKQIEMGKSICSF